MAFIVLIILTFKGYFLKSSHQPSRKGISIPRCRLNLFMSIGYAAHTA
jgi:hypothetical protein